MIVVVRLAPLPLGHRRDARLAEFERVFGTEVHLIEVANVDELTSVVAASAVDAVALDAPTPGRLGEAVAAAAGRGVARLADDELAPSR